MTRKKFLKNVTSKASPGTGKETLIKYFTNGSIKAEGKMSGGKPDGEWKFYRLNGALWQIGFFEKGLKHGRWIRIDSDGNIIYDRTFLKGNHG